MRCFQWLVLGPAFALGVRSVSIPLPAQGQSAPTPSARVTFLDGSSITIRRPRFAYTFSSWHQRQFINAVTADTVVREFHYATRTSGGRVDHSVPLDSIRELRLTYRTLTPPVESETTVVRQRMTVMLRNGHSIVIDQPLFGNDDNLLPAQLAGSTTDSLLFERLSLRGDPTEPGRTAVITVFLLGAGAPANDRFLPRAEQPNEVCHSCRPRSAIVQAVSY